MTPPVSSLAAETQATEPPAQIGSMRIFWPLVEPVLAALAPKTVCEIGMDTGALTRVLLRWSRARGCRYIGIDPTASPEVAALCADEGGQLRKDTSVNALRHLPPSEAYFIDGDHNYYTVRQELRLIARACDSGRSPLIFLHDVSWPWARRDMYYLPMSVPLEARQAFSETLGVVNHQDDLVDWGIREPGRYAIALASGGPGNGVLTAVEDFLAAEPGWELTVLPVAYGLGILRRASDETRPVACDDRLRDLQTVTSVAGKFLEGCEDNYFRLYHYGENVAAALKATQQTKAELHARVESLQQRCDELVRRSRVSLWARVFTRRRS